MSNRQCPVHAPSVAGLGILLSLALVVPLPITAWAGPLQSLGLKLGASVIDQSLRLASGSEFTSDHAHRGVAMGVFAEWRLPRTERLSVVTEGAFLQKGLDSPAWSYGANHWAFPVLAKFTVLPRDSAPYLIGGPSFEFVSDETSGGAYEDDHFVLSWQAGAGVTWRGALAELRYARDRTQSLDHSPFVPDSRASHGWIVQVGYQIRVPAVVGH